MVHNHRPSVEGGGVTPVHGTWCVVHNHQPSVEGGGVTPLSVVCHNLPALLRVLLLSDDGVIM